jgi:hypothetical protein
MLKTIRIEKPEDPCIYIFSKKTFYFVMPEQHLIFYN